MQSLTMCISKYIYLYFLVTFLSMGSTMIFGQTVEWAVTFNGSGNGMDEAKELVLDQSSNVYMVGSTSRSHSQIDIITAKYDPNGNTK